MTRDQVIAVGAIIYLLAFFYSIITMNMPWIIILLFVVFVLIISA